LFSQQNNSVIQANKSDYSYWMRATRLSDLLIIIPKSSGEELHLCICQLNGHTVVDLYEIHRIDDGMMAPRGRGVTISLKDWHGFINGLMKIEEELERRGLLGVTGDR
jgi:hypothetical protein